MDVEEIRYFAAIVVAIIMGIAIIRMGSGRVLTGTKLCDWICDPLEMEYTYEIGCTREEMTYYDNDIDFGFCPYCGGVLSKKQYQYDEHDDRRIVSRETNG